MFAGLRTPADMTCSKMLRLRRRLNRLSPCSRKGFKLHGERKRRPGKWLTGQCGNASAISTAIHLFDLRSAHPNCGKDFPKSFGNLPERDFSETGLPKHEYYASAFIL